MAHKLAIGGVRDRLGGGSGTCLAVEVAPALRPMPRWLWLRVACTGVWRWAQSAPPPGEAGQAAGGTRRQLRWVVGGTLLAAADRLPWVRRRTGTTVCLRSGGELEKGGRGRNAQIAAAHPHCTGPTRIAQAPPALLLHRTERSQEEIVSKIGNQKRETSEAVKAAGRRLPWP